MKNLNKNIFDSPAWLESHATRIVWVTMIMLADKDGLVSRSSAADLASASNVLLGEARRALVALQEVGAIEEVEGWGWRVVDHQRYVGESGE